jgi:hypothetical protein
MPVCLKTANPGLINADCGGSNGNRVRLWKRELQGLADELGVAITVNHLPPGTSKWNRIEHKLFAFITMNWRAKPLVSYLAIIQLIASTTTETGLTVACQLDANAYEKGIKVSDQEMVSLSVKPHSFHGEWNYTIAPRPGFAVYGHTSAARRRQPIELACFRRQPAWKFSKSLDTH